ncbi:2TM domain-containing protein [uncultured Croceitalea sp.]|uniref:2TM domain-containing protein n=1 Tax=uncultured Croceitalea sp. TaxID=1798908 RepID=UPI00330664F6
MFSKNKPKSDVDTEQHELLENAQKRIKQKKRLFSHFVIFLIGSVFIILINKIFKQWESYDWYIWAISVWALLFLVHLFNVFVTHKFMGTAWERKQREKLVAKQKARIAEIQKEIDTDFPVSNFNKKKEV